MVSILKVAVKDSENKVHQKVQPKHQVNNEEDCKTLVQSICREHDIWEIGSCHEDKEVPSALRQVGALARPLNSSFEEDCAQPAEVNDVRDVKEKDCF